MKRFILMSIAFVIAASVLLTACGGGGGGGNNNPGPGPDLSSKKITSYSFTNSPGAETINEAAKTISVIVPHGTDITSLVATFTTTGTSVKVNGVDQVSGTTQNNFANPVACLVTAADGSTVTYTVTVTRSALNLARTGQTTSYYARDDGALQKGVAWPGTRFTDNGNGTITDNLTGLMWLKDANCIKTKYPAFDNDSTPFDGEVTWQHALDFVAGMNSGAYANCNAGYNNWRLPNVNELESLAYGEHVPDGSWWIDAQGFINTAALYWTSTTQAYQTTNALYVNVKNPSGSVSPYPKSVDIFVWPVRDGPGVSTAPAQLPKTGQTASYYTGDDGSLQKGVAWPGPRFVDNGNGTMTDNLTGLMWLKNAECLNNYPALGALNGIVMVSWRAALDAVAGINSGAYPACSAGHNDWRLPNRRELRSLMNYSQANNSVWLNAQGFANVSTDVWSYASTYWSSTHSTDASTTGSNWYLYNDYAVRMYDGFVWPYDQLYDFFPVWPVRGGL